MQDTCPEKVSTDQLSFLLYIDQQAKKKKKKSHKTKPVLLASIYIEEILEKG